MLQSSRGEALDWAWAQVREWHSRSTVRAGQLVRLGTTSGVQGPRARPKLQRMLGPHKESVQESADSPNCGA